MPRSIRDAKHDLFFIQRYDVIFNHCNCTVCASQSIICILFTIASNHMQDLKMFASFAIFQILFQKIIIIIIAVGLDQAIFAFDLTSVKTCLRLSMVCLYKSIIYSLCNRLLISHQLRETMAKSKARKTKLNHRRIISPEQ